MAQSRPESSQQAMQRLVKEATEIRKSRRIHSAGEKKREDFVEFIDSSGSSSVEEISPSKFIYIKYKLNQM